VNACAGSGIAPARPRSMIEPWHGSHGTTTWRHSRTRSGQTYLVFQLSRLLVVAGVRPCPRVAKPPKTVAIHSFQGHNTYLANAKTRWRAPGSYPSQRLYHGERVRWIRHRARATSIDDRAMARRPWDYDVAAFAHEKWSNRAGLTIALALGPWPLVVAGVRPPLRVAHPPRPLDPFSFRAIAR